MRQQITKKALNSFNARLLTTVSFLLAFGLIALYSASTVDSYKNFGNTTYYVMHQLIYGVGLGLFGMYIAYRTDYHIFDKYLKIFIYGSILLLIAVKIPGLGFSAGGATRWIHIGPIFFQPSELAKFAVVTYIASWASRQKQDLNNFYFGILPMLAITAVYAALILWQPDLGTMLVLVSVAASMIYVAGTNLKYFFWTAVVGLLSLYSFIHFAPYRARRLTSFLDPSVDPKGISYHINQALLAIGSGGIFGYGYGLSRQKHNYLPEVMGDSIFAVTAEELGFVRILLAIFLFLYLIFLGFKIAKNAKDTFGKMLAFGITSWVGFQVAINIAAMVNLVPLTGIPLPFFSYGGSAMIVNLSAIGILLNISKQS